MEMDVTGSEVYSVSGLNRSAGRLLEHSFRNIWVQGEITDLSRPASGHLYFVLKDSQARIRCALFRNRRQRHVSELKNGTDLLVRGNVGIYSARGDFQLIIDYLELAGEGLLRRQFEQLKQKLAAEGLFDVNRKRPVPVAPSRVGVITSASGAALQDVLTTLQRRCPLITVSLYPAVVQGEAAVASVIQSLVLANTHRVCDVLLVVRGGGSMEDLQAFNSEAVARAIIHSTIPVITGIGHETDFTIADFIADYRAPTPTAAAELASPDSGYWQQNLLGLQQQLIRAMEHQINDQWQHLDREYLRLKDPLTRIQHARQQLTIYCRQLQQCGQKVINDHRQSSRSLGLRLQAVTPDRQLSIVEQNLSHFLIRLAGSSRARLMTAQQQLQSQYQRLHSVNPETTLQRGYAIVRRQDNQSLVTSAAAVAGGDILETRVRDGMIISAVEC